MTIISKNDRSDPDFLWVELNETASMEFAGGRIAAAADGWQTAYDLSRKFDEYDPRQAGSLNNLAIAYRIIRDLPKSEQTYRDAIEKWQSAAHWVDRMQIPQRARSSLFHLRLENKHREKYDQMLRGKYQKRLQAGLAGTLNNLAELLQSTNRLEEAQQAYHAALEKRLGFGDGAEGEAAVINANLAGLSNDLGETSATPDRATRKPMPMAGFIRRAAKEGWIVDTPPEFTDKGRLMAAILLTHLIDHAHLSSNQ